MPVFVNASLHEVVQEGINLQVVVNLDDEIYECWALNTPKFAPSIYSNYNFNSYCSFEGKAYGANETGVFELTGDSDGGTPINTGVVFPKSVMGIPTGKRLRKGHLGVAGGNPAIILEVEDGTRKVFAVTHDKTIEGNRTVKGREWKLSVTDFDTLDFIKLIPVVLSK